MIVITGSSGFLGKHLLNELNKKYESQTIISLTSKDYDLTLRDDWIKLFNKYNPDTFIHLAAYSGGIGANRKYPADFFYINNLITTYAFEFCSKFKVKKLIYTMGGCSYPANATSPISEDQMWNGKPQKESLGYSSAKKMAIVAAETYKDQYNLDSTILIPGNMYGEYDNFSLEGSHVIPALIRKFYEAKINSKEHVEIWGTGKAQRDFVYANDVAKIIIKFINEIDDKGPINISSGLSTSIYELVNLISEELNYNGNIIWDSSKPDGQMIKIFDTKKLNQLIHGNSFISLKTGIQKTISWFIKNYSDKEKIRL